MSDEKRKRSSQRSEQPTKKVAFSSLPSNVSVSFVEEDDVLAPVIASTPGLSFPQDIALKPYKKGGRDNRILPPGYRPQHIPYELLLQSSNHPRLDYLAEEEKDGSAQGQLNHYVGVFDPETGGLKLMQVHHVTVRSTLRSETEELREEAEKIAAAKASMTARRHNLVTEFGSKKSKKAIVDMTENAIKQSNNDGDIVSSTVLEDMAKSGAAMPTKEEIQAAVDDSKPRPKANVTAETIPEVYTVDTVVGKDLMSSLNVKDWVDSVKKNEGIKMHSKFVARRVHNLARSTESRDIKNLKVLRYILHCIDFHAALKTKGKGAKQVPPKKKLEEQMGITGPVVDAIRRKFASDNNDLTRWHIDNLMTHVAAAALIVDQYEVDVNDLREDLKLTNKEIKQYFHELGCRITAPTETERNKLKITKAEGINHNMAKLKLPLNFPKIKSGPSKRR